MALWNKQEQTPAPEAPIPARLPEPSPSRREDVVASPPPPSQQTSASTGSQSGDLLLGPGAEFEGKLTFKGTIRLDAKFKGQIVTHDVLIVGEHARIDAEITCGTVIVHGEVNGNVTAASGVELRSRSKLRGDVTSPSLLLEKGAMLQGAVKMPGGEKK